MEKELKRYGACVGIDHEDEEGLDSFERRILDAIDELDDLEWDALPDDIKEWSNNKFTDENDDNVKHIDVAAEDDKFTWNEDDVEESEAVAPVKNATIPVKPKKTDVTDFDAAKKAAQDKAANTKDKTSKVIGYGKPPREGTIGAFAYDIMKEAGETGITAKDALPLFIKKLEETKTECGNIEYRIGYVFRDAVKRGIAKKIEGKKHVALL